MRLMKRRLVERALGPVIIDLMGDTLTAEERETLLHPYVGGVILFSRNFECVAQIKSLIKQIHELRTPPLLVSVDHEGGRVQRFKEGFTHIPPMRKLGVAYDQSPETALKDAETLGWLLAAELRTCGIDYSYTPVLDLDYGSSTVIGDRAFHSDPAIVAKLATAFITGLSDEGMSNVGKHFPGHGYVVADSHLELPVDNRTFEEIADADLRPFVSLVRAGLAGIMPAHVVYPKVDSFAAGFSPYWLQEVLRKEMGFSGVIISDDLSMAGAISIGPPPMRAEAAFEAGCDAILVCNNRQAAIEVLDKTPKKIIRKPKQSLEKLMPAMPFIETMEDLKQTEEFNIAQKVAEKIHALELPEEAGKIKVAEYKSVIELM